MSIWGNLVGAVVPVTQIKNALSKMGGDMEGPINMNGQTLSGLNAPVEATEPVTKGHADETYASQEYSDKTYASKEYADSRNPYNHIDNSDFTQFVAQAGIGGKHGTQAYAGDRWILDSGTVTGDANKNGNGYSNIKLNGTIRQIIADPPEVGTVFVEMVSGTATAVYENGAVTITSAGGVIQNVALYEGTYTTKNLPKYQPKGYGAELTECLRFYQKIIDVYAGIIQGQQENLSFLFFIPMRVNPTVKATVQKYTASGWVDSYNPQHTANRTAIRTWLTETATHKATYELFADL